MIRDAVDVFGVSVTIILGKRIEMTRGWKSRKAYLVFVGLMGGRLCFAFDFY